MSETEVMPQVPSSIRFQFQVIGTMFETLSKQMADGGNLEIKSTGHGAFETHDRYHQRSESKRGAHQDHLGHLPETCRTSPWLAAPRELHHRRVYQWTHKHVANK